MEKNHREAAQWKYYFMKYDILVKTFTSSLVRKQYLPKKKSPFLGQNLEKNLSKSVSGYYKTKKKSGMDH